jgi:AraC family transcriptional regulator
MSKYTSSTQQKSRINDTLNFIHANLGQILRADKLAEHARYSEQHFHRLFHAIVGESVNCYIRRIRLESAANQLMLAPEQSIDEIAYRCGFHSLSSFSRVFKQKFGTSPGRWRTAKAINISPPYLENSEISQAYNKLAQTPLPPVTFVDLAPKRVAYIRHMGYSRSIRHTWQSLNAWAMSEGISANEQYGLHHSNPTQTPLEQCRYVACIEVESFKPKRGVVNYLEIPGGLHAKFDFSGKYGELLPSISKVLEQWLPHSGFICKLTPAFVQYHQNHFLRDDEHYCLTFYLPIGID